MMAPSQSRENHLKSVVAQMNLPGIDRAQYKKAGWDKDNPRPETFDQAMAYLRKKPCKLGVDYKEYDSKLRATLKIENTAGNQRTFILDCDIDLEDGKTINDSPDDVIALAQEAHRYQRMIQLAESC